MVTKHFKWLLKAPSPSTSDQATRVAKQMLYVETNWPTTTTTQKTGE